MKTTISYAMRLKYHVIQEGFEPVKLHVNNQYFVIVQLLRFDLFFI